MTTFFDFLCGFFLLLFGFLFGALFYVWYVIAKLETHEAYLDDGCLVWREREMLDGYWTSATEALPKDGQMVLGCWYFRGRLHYWVCEIVSFSSDTDEWRFSPFSNSSVNSHTILPVTHWMPLPEAPDGREIWRM